MTEYKCVFCDDYVHTETFYGQGGTRWVHSDGYLECAEVTYAAPMFNHPKP